MESAIAQVFLKHNIPQEQHSTQMCILSDCMNAMALLALSPPVETKPKRHFLCEAGDYLCYKEGDYHVFLDKTEKEIYRTNQIDETTFTKDKIKRIIQDCPLKIGKNIALTFQSFPVNSVFSAIKAVHSTYCCFGKYPKQYFKIEHATSGFHTIGLSPKQLYIAGKSRMEISTAVIQKAFIYRKDDLCEYKPLSKYSWNGSTYFFEGTTTNEILDTNYEQIYSLMLSGTRTSDELVHVDSR